MDTLSGLTASRFLRVTVSGTLLVPTLVVGNVNDVGVRLSAGVPVPMMKMDCCVTALSEMVMFA